jgi:hypothetical protein
MERLLPVGHDRHLAHISLERVLQFPLGPVPWSLATSDDTQAKTDKSRLMHCLDLELHFSEKPAADKNIYIIDGNIMFQSQVALPSTFEELADSRFAKLPNMPRVGYVTNSYFQYSIKSIERNRRGTSAIHLIKGSATKVPPRDWRPFLSNSENKSIFVRFLQDKWKQNRYAVRFQRR